MAPLDLPEAKMGEDYAMYMKDHAMATVFCPEFHGRRGFLRSIEESAALEYC